jgi:ketosteroid isomerase-like protein
MGRTAHEKGVTPFLRRFVSGNVVADGHCSVLRRYRRRGEQSGPPQFDVRCNREIPSRNASPLQACPRFRVHAEAEAWRQTRYFASMSEENVELIERFFELYNRRQIDAWVEMLAPDLEWHIDPEDPDATTHHGTEAVKRHVLYWAELMNTTVQVREIFEASDDQAVAWTRVETRGELSGAAAGQDLAFIFKLRDGLVVRVQETQDKREALGAVGLSEQDAHADS